MTGEADGLRGYGRSRPRERSGCVRRSRCLSGATFPPGQRSEGRAGTGLPGSLTADGRHWRCQVGPERRGSTALRALWRKRRVLCLGGDPKRPGKGGPLTRADLARTTTGT